MWKTVAVRVRSQLQKLLSIADPKGTVNLRKTRGIAAANISR